MLSLLNVHTCLIAHVLAVIALAGCAAAPRDGEPAAATSAPAGPPSDENALAAPVQPLLAAPCGRPDACAAACDRGDARACTQLGTMHLLGDPFVPPDRSPERAGALLVRACELGHAEGCAQAAMHFSGILGGPRDEARAADLLRQAEQSGQAACARGDARSCWDIAPHPNAASDPAAPVRPEHLDLWRRACAAGLADACTARAFSLQTSAPELAARLAARALALHEAACDRGDPWACVTAALRHQEAGRSDRAAALWKQRLARLEQQCAAGLGAACIGLSQIYDPAHSDQGAAKDPAKDPAQAARWAERACAAQTPVDCAVAWCRRAVELGGACPPR